MLSGSVKFFNESKGWGFIKADDGRELFVHYHDLISDGFKTLNKDDRVSFDVQQNPKGLAAVNVKVVG